MISLNYLTLIMSILNIISAAAMIDEHAEKEALLPLTKDGLRRRRPEKSKDDAGFGARKISSAAEAVSTAVFSYSEAEETSSKRDLPVITKEMQPSIFKICHPTMAFGSEAELKVQQNIFIEGFDRLNGKAPVVISVHNNTSKTGILEFYGELKSKFMVLSREFSPHSFTGLHFNKLATQPTTFFTILLPLACFDGKTQNYQRFIFGCAFDFFARQPRLLVFGELEESSLCKYIKLEETNERFQKYCNTIKTEAIHEFSFYQNGDLAILAKILQIPGSGVKNIHVLIIDRQTLIDKLRSEDLIDSTTEEFSGCARDPSKPPRL